MTPDPFLKVRDNADILQFLMLGAVEVLKDLGRTAVTTVLIVSGRTSIVAPSEETEDWTVIISGVGKFRGIDYILLSDKMM